MKTTVGKWFLGFAVLALAGSVWAQEQTAAPRIITSSSPPFYGFVEVTFESATPGATIYYTLDGSVPDTGSDVFDGTPVILEIGTTLVQAFATADAMIDSFVTSMEVTVLPPRVANPVIEPFERHFYGEVVVTISSATAGATIYYTLDGSTPTHDSPVFDPADPIVLREKTVVKALAALEGMDDSEVAVKTYRELNIILLGNPTTLSGLADEPERKSYFRIQVPANASRLVISISGGSGDCDLLVKFGRPPTPTDYDYFPETPANEETVEVDNPAAGEWFILLWAAAPGYQDVTLRVSYSTSSGAVEEPVITPVGRFRPGRLIVQMFQPQGFTIRYTLDGSEPHAGSSLYVGPIRVLPKIRKVTVKAKAFAPNGETSDTVTTVYKLGKRVKPGTSRLLTDNLGRKKFFAVVVPDGVSRLTIGTTGGVGDCDLWARADKFPSKVHFDYISENPTSEEQIVIDNPPAGEVYYIMVFAFTGYSGVEFYVDME